MVTDPTMLIQFFSIGSGLVFYITLLIFTIYSVLLGYHWFSYGTKKSAATLALAVYLLGSAPLFIIMSITL